MQPKFWKEIWRKEKIGFHQREINERLRTFFPALDLPNDSSVFVPLCGKSLDMRWIREQGHPVIGVELSRRAVAAFFSEADLEPTITNEPPFERWSADGINILCGDFFNLTRDHLSGVRAFYDRAALVALPPEMRSNYARHLGEILPADAVGGLLGVEYEQSEMNGPPFSVEEDEVRRIFEEDFYIETVVREDVLERTRFRERLSTLIETVYILHRRNGESMPTNFTDAG